MPRCQGLPIIAITMGDPAGIGPELSLRVLADDSIREWCLPLVLGEAWILQEIAERRHWTPPRRIISLADWVNGTKVEAPTLIDCAELPQGSVQPGRIDRECGRAACRYIEAAIKACQTGRAAAVATNPIHKESIRLAGVPFPGHTELFAERTGTQRYCMMLAAESLLVSFVTTHIGYAQVPQQLSVERVQDVIALTHAALQRLRNRPPRIAVCGLNPHAGEHGLFGDREEERFIIPAIEAARAKGMEIEGPLPPDAAFLPERLQSCGAIVCMYHDQGHIPFKMQHFDKGVNITLGLPIVRTSVDHGTAFDIAWQGVARPSCLIQALRWAVRLSSPVPPAVGVGDPAPLAPTTGGSR